MTLKCILDFGKRLFDNQHQTRSSYISGRGKGANVKDPCHPNLQMKTLKDTTPEHQQLQPLLSHLLTESLPCAARPRLHQNYLINSNTLVLDHCLMSLQNVKDLRLHQNFLANPSALASLPSDSSKWYLVQPAWHLHIHLTQRQTK